MDAVIYAGFMDEFLKIAQETSVPAKDPMKLTPMDKEKYLKYGLIGAASGPVIAGARNLILGAKPGAASLKGAMRVTGGHAMGRWLPAMSFVGAATGAAIPILRRRTEMSLRNKYDAAGNPLSK